MGEAAKKALQHIKNRKRDPVYRVQGHNPSPESLLPQQSSNNQQRKDLNNITENTKADIKEKISMNNKPMIQCPHCDQIISADNMPSQRVYRNELGLDVFECPDCHTNYKIEPRDYLKARDHIEKGNSPNTHIIKAAKVDEILPSEKMVIKYDQRPRAPWRRPAKFIAVIIFFNYCIPDF